MKTAGETKAIIKRENIKKCIRPKTVGGSAFVTRFECWKFSFIRTNIWSETVPF